ncbi:MAG: IPT/TIG domain-containing protein [Acidobacteriota bacterium]
MLTTLTVGADAQQPLGPGTPRQPLAPQARAITRFGPVVFRDAAAREARNGPERKTEIEEIEEPQPPPPVGRRGVPIPPNAAGSPKVSTNTTPSFGTGVSPGPSKTFKAEFLSSTSIPPDTMGAVGTTHIVSVTNDRMRIQTREGVEVSRMTLTSFWAGVTIKGAAISAFDPKVMFDRFNNRFILISSGNGQNVNSGAMFAVSATADPTGAWYRWAVAADAASTAAGGHWIDYPSMGFNKDWIVVNENVFNFGTAGGGFWGTQIYVLDKQAAYANTLGTINVFEAAFVPGCTGSATPELELGCGFTMAPTINEDNATSTVYLVEDWDSGAAQLRLSKITGTAATPVLTVGTQFPQSSEAWRFDAVRISNKTTATVNGTTVTSSGGYMPQRQQSANLTSGTRVMANDSRVQNAVLRNGTLWCTHTVMLSATSQPAGTLIGGAGNPIDLRSGIQWWAIDPTIETGAAQAPLQRGRFFDPAADNCHNGLGGQNIIAGRCTSTATQVGEFYAFPNISVNQNDDVFIGFTRFTPLTYPNSAYVIRRSTDAVNTTRDVVVFRPGQANYNIGAGTSTAVHPASPTRQNRWGDYSSAQTDPLNDTDFWTVQEYSGTVRDFGIGLAGNWETWWALVKPSGVQPTTSGTAIISEFRLRGPQGVRDEFVEIYNPGATPIIVNTTDGSDGWSLAYSANGTTLTAVVAVIPNGTVIAPRGHFLIVDNPDAGNGPTLSYSLNAAAATVARGADSDTGWSLDLADNGGLALFNTANSANYAAGTRLDSAGFASIAAGLYKEGNGVPAVTAATPTGQMTFYRNLTSGTPADTGANETDFVFANPVVGETLGSAPILGAAGPENLDSPIHLNGSTTLAASLLDTGVGLGTAPNRERTPGAVANGAFGTLTFRRKFTNNIGSDLTRLRFRIVDMTTSPAAGPFADLRALNSTGGLVPVSVGPNVSVDLTSVEVPPTQAAGGGLNATLTVPSVTAATPLAAAGTTNLAFTLGVQVTGQYNFCLVPEGDPAPSLSTPLCFAGTTENAAPSITPSPVGVTAGDPASVGLTIATVSDVEDLAGSLSVVVTAAPVGISVTNIVNTTGTITADVSATCGAPAGANNVTLQVMDSQGATATGTLVVTVTPTPAPTVPVITGSTSTCAGTPVTLTATSTGATSYQWYLDGNPLGGEITSTTSASTAGSYTVTATNSCGTTAQSAPHVLTVTPLPPTPTISGATSFCTGGSTTLTSSAASGNQWYLNGNPIGGEINTTLVVTAAGNYQVAVTSGGCTSALSSVTAVTENPIPPTPTITPGGPTTFCAGGNVTLTSSSASGNQWSLNGNPIGGATAQQYVASVAGDYTVVVTTSGCPSAASAVTTVTINPIPSATITAPGSMVSGATSNASVPDAGVGATYVWGITNGTFNGVTTGATVNFTAGAVGSVGLSVTVTASGCPNSGTANVTVTAAPPSVTLTQVNPAAGRITGGTPVTLTGTGFLTGVSVTFGGSAATSVVRVNSTTITAVTPAHVAGAVNVVVTNTDTSSATLTNGYTYLAQQFDANNDGIIDPSDIFYLVNYLFSGGPAPNGPAGLLSGDANGDNVVDPADIFYVVNYLFLGGPAPMAVSPRVATDAVGTLSGSVSLGTAVVRDGRTFIPVTMSMTGATDMPSFALKVRLTGDGSVVAIRRAGATKQIQPAFEITRATSDGAAYLVAFAGDRVMDVTTVVAEIELARGQGAVRIDIDPLLTMLSSGGVRKATVAGGTLQVHGVSVGGRTIDRPVTRERN